MPESLYPNHECELPGLEEHYRAPDGPWPDGWVTVIELPVPEEEGGGQVVVEEYRLPARSYRITFQGVTLRTGCGWDVPKLVADIVRAVAGGLLTAASR